jgi:hypothetical protein
LRTAPRTLHLTSRRIDDLPSRRQARARHRHLNRAEPIQTDIVTTYAVGERNTIAGLAWGVEGMRVGGRRRLRVGPAFGVPG